MYVESMINLGGWVSDVSLCKNINFVFVSVFENGQICMLDITDVKKA
jgi:hypothetical protein